MEIYSSARSRRASSPSPIEKMSIKSATGSGLGEHGPPASITDIPRSLSSEQTGNARKIKHIQRRCIAKLILRRERNYIKDLQLVADSCA